MFMNEVTERERLITNIQLLTERDMAAVAALVDALLDDEPPLSEDELRQLAESEEDIAAGDLIPWEEARARLEALP